MLQLTTPSSISKFNTAIASFPLGTEDLVPNAIIPSILPPTHLSAFVRQETMNNILNTPGCIGLRFYPAMENNKLVFVIGGVKSDNSDFSDDDDACGCAYPGPGMPSRDISFAEGTPLVNGEGSDPQNLVILNTLQNIGNSLNIFKAFFSKSFLQGIFTTNPFMQYRFHIAEITFSDHPVPQRTIVMQFPDANGQTEVHASMLPCPPHCGGGGYRRRPQ